MREKNEHEIEKEREKGDDHGRDGERKRARREIEERGDDKW